MSEPVDAPPTEIVAAAPDAVNAPKRRRRLESLGRGTLDAKARTVVIGIRSRPEHQGSITRVALDHRAKLESGQADQAQSLANRIRDALSMVGNSQGLTAALDAISHAMLERDITPQQARELRDLAKQKHRIQRADIDGRKLRSSGEATRKLLLRALGEEGGTREGGKA